MQVCLYVQEIFSQEYYLRNAECDEKITEKHPYDNMFCSYCDTWFDIVERNKSAGI